MKTFLFWTLSFLSITVVVVVVVVIDDFADVDVVSLEIESKRSSSISRLTKKSLKLKKAAKKKKLMMTKQKTFFSILLFSNERNCNKIKFFEFLKQIF